MSTTQEVGILSAKLSALSAFGDVSKQKHADESTTEKEKQTHRYVDLKLSPVLSPRATIAQYPCQEASCKDNSPAQSWMKTEFNVNAKHGGGTALLLMSRKQGLKEGWGDSEVQLIRCGFDGNHVEGTSLGLSSKHTIYHWHEINTDTVGKLCPAAMYGNSHCSLLSNIASMGHCGCAVVCDSPTGDAATSTTQLGPGFETFGGCFLVLCSTSSEKKTGNLYYVHQGESMSSLLVKPLSPEGSDLWQFTGDDDGGLEVTGPSQSHYAILHTYTEQFTSQHTDKPMGKVYHTQAFDGTAPTTLLKECRKYVGRSAMLMCSCSSGTENDTTSALYQVTLQESDVEVFYVGGSSGTFESPSLWTISVCNDELVVTGPSSPCRYGVISNIPEDVADLTKRCDQGGCLATGKETLLSSGVEVRDTAIVGWVSADVPLQIWINANVIERIGMDQLMKQPDERLGFRHELNEEESSPGLKVIRVYALQQSNNVTIPVELEGSPIRLQFQPPGVAYAVNLGGPAYEASNHIVYADTQTTFTFDKVQGYQCKRIHSNFISKQDNMYGIMANTNDGLLYSTCVKTNFDDETMRIMTFEIPLPAGQYTLTIHTTGALVDQDVMINGQPYSSQISKAISEIRDVIPCLTARDASVPFTAEGGTTIIKFDTLSISIDICALTIVNADKYRQPEQTTEESQKEALDTQKLSDKLVPLDRTFITKEMKIVGWSSNLLQNSSGEADDFSHWDVSGEWKINTFGGDQTETKFVSSYMDCEKYQEIDLSQHFSEAYLDSAPEIQACESFHEGCNHGGFYTFTVTLMTRDRDVVETKTTGEQCIGIETRDWIRENFSFTGYGKGVRLLGFKTVARDDKYWVGHFGAYASAALVRVKSEVAAAKGDVHEDIVADKLSKQALHELTKIILDLNEEYRDGLSNIRKTIDVNSANEHHPTSISSQDSIVETISTHDNRIRRRKKREIRLFVSSTFVDFRDEREVLIKKVFREINRLCLDRGVFFSYIDLRWGITAEQSKDGKTIFICLSEVDRCRPYFICLMGDRFGWNQTEEKKDELLDKTYDYALQNMQGFEWLNEYRYKTSVTKLEVLHAALRKDDTNQSRTFFYLREPRVQRDQLPTPQENKRGESQWHFDQQKIFRGTVMKLGKNTRDFKTAEEVGAKIKEDLMRSIDEDFPPGSQLSHIEQEREAHEAFADIRKRVYIGREEYFEAIDEHFRQAATDGNNEPLVIMGTSGSGKSALVANWCGRFEEKNPDDFLFMHFIGSSPESASYLNLLRRLYEELRAYLQQDLVVPSTDRSLVLELPTWLKLASNRGNRVMIVFDALNQLDSGAGNTGEEHELKWLPKELPHNVHLLMSTLPGKAKDAVVEAGWPTLQVHPLNPSEKMEIITGYMSMYSKTLNAEQLKIIIDAEQSNNPLYLKALLDEVRMFGSYEQLTDAIKTYLLAKDPGELFVKILERLESDFESGTEARRGLVRDATTAIWCSHRGMSEQELVNHLQIQSNIWSPFYLSLEENLVNRNGLVNFFHDYMRQAVERKYLASDEEKRKGHLALATFFIGEDIDNRYVDEVPYLLAKAGEMKRLKATVLNIAAFQRLMNTEEGKYQLIKSWQLLGGYDQVEEAYLEVLNRSDWNTVGDKASLMRLMAGFFMQLGLLKGAKLLLDSLLTELEERHLETDGVIVYHHGNNSFKLRCNHPDVIDVLIETGTVCRKLDLLSNAFDKFQDALSRQPKPKTPAAKLRYVKTLMGLGSVERRRGNAEQAKRFLTRALEVTTTVLGSNHHYDASIIGQIGELSYSQGVLGDAILHHLWDLKLTQNEVGLNHPRVAAILNNIALVLDDLNTTIAGDLFQAVLSILVEAYGKDHLDVAIVRYNLGVFFLADNFYQRARYQFHEALRIFTGFLGEEHPHTKTTIIAINKLRDLVEEK